jgi:hypothetical protein
MSREYLPCPPQMRNDGPLPAHLSSSSAFALGESRWLYPPQRAPDALRPPILGFLTQCEQIKNTSRENMRNGGTPPAHLDKAEWAKAFDDEWLRLKEEAFIRINEEHCGLRPPFVATNITDFLQSVEATDARNHHALEALDALNHQALEALETRHCQALEAYIAYDAPALLTTTWPELPAMLFPSPRPTSSYLGAALNTTGGGHLSSDSTSPTVAVPTSLSVVKEVLAERTSANDNEADGCTRALPPTDMPAKAIGKDTQRTVTDEATPRRVVAERNTPGMWPTSDDTTSSPELTPAATLTESLSSSPRPTTYVGVVLSNMGERAHATPLAVTPSSQSSAEPQPSAADGHFGMVCHCARPRRHTGRRHRPRARSRVAAMVAVINLERPICLVTRLFPPTLIQR